MIISGDCLAFSHYIRVLLHYVHILPCLETLHYVKCRVGRIEYEFSILNAATVANIMDCGLLDRIPIF